MTANRNGAPARGNAVAKGFSLVELVVTIAVLAILIAIAIPSFTALFNSSRLSGAANDLVAGIQAARIESVRRNQQIRFCRSDNGTTCAGGGNGSTWMNWIVTAPDNTVIQSGVIRAPVELRSSRALTANTIVFRPDGFARDSATPTGNVLAASLGVCIPTVKPIDNGRVISIAGGSRIATTSVNLSGNCPQPGN